MKTIENYWCLDKIKIKERYTIDEHGELHGLYERWDEHGQLRVRCYYEHDKLHGLYEWWYDSGQLMERINYEQGKLHGLYEKWDANGQLLERCYYEQGKRIVMNAKIIQTQHNISLYEAKLVQLGERLHSALESNNSTAYRAIEEEIKKTQQHLKDEIELLYELQNDRN